MKPVRKKFGVTLPEMIVTITVITVMVSLAMPAVKSLYNSIGNSPAATKSMISAAMASAKAIAIKNQRYAGVRFQKVYNPESGPLNADQYMIIIINGEIRQMHNINNGFYAVEGINPMKLPSTIGVIDPTVILDNQIEPEELTNATSFSVIFSPSGKLVVRDVRVRNRDGETEGTQTQYSSSDETFNTLSKVQSQVAQFVQDDYPPMGLSSELSSRAFAIYDRQKFKQAYEKGLPFDYLQQLEPIFINSYTGTIINREN